jgi:hypothetical protein
MSSGMRKISVGAFVTIACLGMAACGTEQHENQNRPPAAIILSAAITPSRISVSPARVGAGPVTIVVTNQTASSQQLTFESVSGAVRQQTGPINPQDTATLKAEVTPGAYLVRVAGGGIRPAPVVFGPERPSAQNDLDIP